MVVESRVAPLEAITNTQDNHLIMTLAFFHVSSFSKIVLKISRNIPGIVYGLLMTCLLNCYKGNYAIGIILNSIIINTGPNILFGL